MKKKKDDGFDLTKLAKACSQKDLLCICDIDNLDRKLCIKNDGSSIIIPSYFNKHVDLPKTLGDEKNPFVFSILNHDIGVFQHPCYSYPVICLKSNDENRRLCFDIKNKTSFISGPTDFSILHL